MLVVKEHPDALPESPRCWATTSDLEAPVATVASYAAQRWDIDTWIEDTKELLGLNHYQVTSTEGVVRSCHMVCCCYLYLDQVRARLVAQGQQGATIGDALRLQQGDQHSLLLQWLWEQFAQGHNAADAGKVLLAA